MDGRGGKRKRKDIRMEECKSVPKFADSAADHEHNKFCVSVNDKKCKACLLPFE